MQIAMVAVSKDNLFKRKCNGPPAWVGQPTVNVISTAAIKDNKHRRVYSGSITWCAKCGSYLETRGRGLALICNTAPEKNVRGGMWWQREQLLRRKHPVRLTFMEEHRNADGTLWMPQGSGYANLAVDADAPPPECFYRYQPE